MTSSVLFSLMEFSQVKFQIILFFFRIITAAVPQFKNCKNCSVDISPKNTKSKHNFFEFVIVAFLFIVLIGIIILILIR